MVSAHAHSHCSAHSRFRYQCILTCIICYILGLLGERERKPLLPSTDTDTNAKSFLADFPMVRYQLSNGIAILPLSAVFVGMVAFNNICLQYVQVSFYNVARCLSLIFNVIFTWMLLGKTTSYMTMGTLLVVLVGFVAGTLPPSLTPSPSVRCMC